MPETKYAIIGAGIAGSSIAYHLSERVDEEITVFEQGSPASETTAKSMALLGGHGNETTKRMKRYGLDLYNRFLRHSRTQTTFNHIGHLALSTTEAGAETLRHSVEQPESADVPETDSLAAGHDETSIEYLEGGDLTQSLMIPYLNTEEIEGAIYRPKTGYIKSRELTFEFIERAQDNGVTFRTDSKIDDILVEDNQVTGIVCKGERIDAEYVICAAGPWNVQMAAIVGVSLPVKHTLAPILKLRPNTRLAHIHPHTKHYESGVYFRGNSDGTVFVGYNPSHVTDFDSAEVYNLDEISQTVPADIRTEALDLLDKVAPSLATAPVVDEYVGVRSMTPDGKPIVGWTNVEGFSIAAFHSSGIQLAPAVGQVIATQLADGDPTSYYDSLSITRFDPYTDVS